VCSCQVEECRRIAQVVITVPEHLKGRHFTRVADWNREDLATLLELASELKAAQRERREHRLLPGRGLGMIFEKPSTRTRVSFEVGIAQLGGFGVHLPSGELQLGRGEAIRDTAVVLSRYLDAIMIRTFAQADVDELAEHASVPVINGLTDATHPCQALADLLTISERLGRLEGVRVAYVGDGNNVLHSLAAACNRLGLGIVAATPEGYEPDPAESERAGGIELVRDPAEAVAGAQAVYTDVWTSMGQEEERERRLRAFRGYRVDAEVLRRAPEAIVLHCLPAHYGEEITEDVLYGPASAVWDQAENRLHTQKALLALVVR
jgi:ornithine carbamoyltransferase